MQATCAKCRRHAVDDTISWIQLHNINIIYVLHVSSLCIAFTRGGGSSIGQVLHDLPLLLLSRVRWSFGSMSRLPWTVDSSGEVRASKEGVA